MSRADEQPQPIVVATPWPVETTEDAWDAEIGIMMTLAAVTGLRYGGTICDAKIRQFGISDHSAWSQK